jgi:hypothetical protein
MGEGIIKRLLGSLRKTGNSILNVRRGGNTLRVSDYGRADFYKYYKKMQSFYIGLSLLSNNKPGVIRLHNEAIRVLEALDREHSRFLSPDIPACLRRDPGGRPGFADDHADFNLSHSQSIVAVAFSGERSRRTGQPLHTGCDIQYLSFRKAYRTIADTFYSPEERAYIDAGKEEQEKNLRFHHIWTIKESYLKLQGLSVFDMGKVPAFVPAGNRKNPMGEYMDTFFTLLDSENHRFIPRVGEQAPLFLTFYLYELGEFPAQYILTVVRERDEDMADPGIRWFSQKTLPLISIAKIKAVVSPVTTARSKI